MRLFLILMTLSFVSCGRINTNDYSQYSVRYEDPQSKKEDPHEKERKDPKGYEEIKGVKISTKHAQTVIDALTILEKAKDVEEKELKKQGDKLLNAVLEVSKEVISDATQQLVKQKMVEGSEDTEFDLKISGTIQKGEPFFATLSADEKVVGFLRVEFKLDKEREKVESVNVQFKKLKAKK